MKKQLLCGAFALFCVGANNSILAQNFSTVQVGRSSGIYREISVANLETLPSQLNPIIFDPQSGLLLFVHQHDVSIWGGGNFASGKFRYDLSTDGGLSFSTEIGELNPMYTYRSMFPQAAIFNPSASTAPLDQKLVYTGSTLDASPAVNGQIAGVSDITTSSPISTENYLPPPSSNPYITASLVQAQPGVFFTVEPAFDGINFSGEIRIHKGVWNSNTSDVDWDTAAIITPPYYLGFDGAVHLSGLPVIAFAPDGQKGWLAFAADLLGDTTKSPVFYKTIDGGITWTGPHTVNLAAYTWASATQSLRSMTSDYDLTVDANGNPHLVAGIWMRNEAAPDYSVLPQLGGRLTDITSPDGGASWEFKQVAPLLTYRTPNIGSINTVHFYNFVQCGRDTLGEYVFYSWTDSDTTMVGFGEYNNIAPNLRISALRVNDGYRTCVKLLSDGDILWDGRIIAPYLSPLVPENQGTFNLPIVFAETILSNEFDQPIQFNYAGNSATIRDYEFEPFGNYDISWTNILTDTCVHTPVAQSQLESDFLQAKVFPNPAEAYINVQLSGATQSEVSLSLVSMQGVVLSTQTTSLSTDNMLTLDVKTLPAGLYFVYIVNAEQTYIHKICKQ